jgi:hypothetical protein
MFTTLLIHYLYKIVQVHGVFANAERCTRYELRVLWLLYRSNQYLVVVSVVESGRVPGTVCPGTGTVVKQVSNWYCKYATSSPDFTVHRRLLSGTRVLCTHVIVALVLSTQMI